MTALEAGERAACVGLIAEECAGPVEWLPVGQFSKQPRPLCQACSDAGARHGLVDRRSGTADRRATRPALEQLREFADRQGPGERRAVGRCRCGHKIASHGIAVDDPLRPCYPPCDCPDFEAAS